MSENNNGRVTLAVVQTEIKHLGEKIDKLTEDHEDRLRKVEKDVTKLQVATGRQWVATALGTLGATLSGIFVSKP
jgi:tetrahydromethanopterin S-methyltransferase subunit B